jgi:hypothetical protein
MVSVPSGMVIRGGSGGRSSAEAFGGYAIREMLVAA